MESLPDPEADEDGRKAWEGLKPAHQAFILAYIENHGNGSKAYQTVYGAKPETAAVSAHHLLSNPNFLHVQQALAYQQGVDSARLAVNREKILAELAKIAFLNPQTIHNPDGSAKPLDAISEVDAAAIAEVRQIVKGDLTQTTYRTHDKLQAIKQLRECLGIGMGEHEAVGAERRVVIQVGQQAMISVQGPDAFDAPLVASSSLGIVLQSAASDEP